MTPHVVPQPLNPIVPDDKPQLQSTETPAQRDVPVSIVKHSTGISRAVTQILRHNTQCPNQCLSVSHIETIAIEIGEHPLMRVEAITVRELNSLLKVTILGAKSRSTGHGCVDV